MKRVYIDGEKLKAAMLNTGITIKTICNGIGYQSDSFIYKEPAEEPKCSIDYVALYNTIYQAVLTALQENAKGLHDRLFEVK